MLQKESYITFYFYKGGGNFYIFREMYGLHIEE